MSKLISNVIKDLPDKNNKGNQYTEQHKRPLVYFLLSLVLAMFRYTNTF